ncbi:MAG: pyridoxal-phosphate dependent enzyme [Lachnospiraceae bacterium]|nr:pyridoxal-phosphate dependent enzyme [Lachnospiraceae bacterium]
MDTIIQRLAMDDTAGNEFYIKRDDLLPFSIGGNKVRIAEAFYEDMKAKGGDTMIIYGSRHSNLCRVLSDLCFSRGTKCVMICSHEAGEDDAPTNNTHLITWTGTEIVNCAKNEIAQTVERVMNNIQESGGTPYYIYGDKYGKGNEGTAARAYAEAYREILRQEQEMGVAFDYIFCPSGTGATQTGLTCGHLLAGDRKKIMGVMISSRETERAYQVIEEGIQTYFAEHPEVREQMPEDLSGEIHLLDAYRQEGYGKYDARVEACIRQQYLANGIPLDPIYTAKAFWGMAEYVRDAGIHDSRILFLHTGGTPLFFDYVSNSSEQQQKP